MKRATTKAEDLPNGEQSRRDDGVTFIEILVTVVLLGTVVIGVLTAIRATVIATRLERDHSKAQQWLQSATQVIEADDFGDCRDASNLPLSHATVLAQYRDEIQAKADAPYGWNAPQLTVVSPLDIWNGSQWVQYPTAGDCYDDFGLRLQRVTVQVTSPKGDILETIQVVKSD